MRLLLLAHICCITIGSCAITKRALQESHEKSRLEKWQDRYLAKSDISYDQTTSLINLVNKIASNHLSGCTSIILYDRFTEDSSDLLLEKLFRTYPLLYVHGQISEEYHVKVPKVLKDQSTCVNYILFLKDVMRSRNIIGPQIRNKVVVIARSSQWRVYEFLASERSQSFMNLLVVAMSEKIYTKTEGPYILYTHKLYIDALGSSTHQVLTSWKNGTLTRPEVSLFPKKMTTFAGHRFIVSIAHQPPFVIKKSKNEFGYVQWDGIETRTIEMLSKMYNFSTDYREAKDPLILGPSEAVLKAVSSAKANLGVAGIYVTDKRISEVDASTMHTQDCAAFISLTSTALPKYRAIMGPFHWSVWICLTFVYLLAIFPLAFSDKHSLRHLLKQPEEVENMFWYVFGTFTNAFSFVGRNSWTRTHKLATRLLIGFYWLFTIIITACYTGSIIAFVTLPVYPEALDKPEQLLGGRYRIGMLNKGGWPDWFRESNDTTTQKLMKDIELQGDVSSGLKNVTKAFFWPYAFLGSRAELDYIVRTNFTTQNKRSLLHISSQCFVPFSVSFIYGKNSLYGRVLDDGILKLSQTGLLTKIKRDIEWQLMMSATGKLLAASSYGASVRNLAVDDRALTLDDTQGMFLLLGIGFVLGGISLLTEWFGGCMHLCKKSIKQSASTVASNNRSHDAPTPRERIDSLRYCNHPEMSDHRASMVEIKEEEHNCIVHKENSIEDMDVHIDRLFDFDHVFGEKKGDDEEIDVDKML